MRRYLAPSRVFATVALLSALFVAGAPPSAGAPVAGEDVTYTSSADFAKGTLVNLNADTPGQLRLNSQTSTFPFVWIALSARETIAKIDTRTGDILGEYRAMSDGSMPISASQSSSAETSRTTVVPDGSVWVGHRANSSVAHVGLRELNQCVDRNGNGTIDTSTGYGDIKPWPGGTFGASAPASAATDECILHQVDTPGSDSRHMSVDADGNLWVGAFNGGPGFVKVDGRTGTFMSGNSTTFAREADCGGYGGFVDRNGVLWSSNGGSNGLLRWDTTAPDAPGVNPRCVPVVVYGLAIDPGGNVWANEYGPTVRKISPQGEVLGTFPNHSPSGSSQGLAVDRNGDVWISSYWQCTGGSCGVSHLRNDGTFVGVVPNPEGFGSSGVAVDAAGKIWTANYRSSTATRIDPTAGAFSTTPGLETVRVGAVDQIVRFPMTPAADPFPGAPAASPYNYSDMTGNVALTNTAPQGSWTVVQDSGRDSFQWHTISFNNEAEGFVPPGAFLGLNVEARAADSEAALGSAEYQGVQSCVVINGLSGRFLQLRLTLRPNAAGESPIVSDVVVRGGPNVKAGECTPQPLGRRHARGYAVITADGGIHPRGELAFVGTASTIAAPSGRTLTGRIVGAAATPTGRGYYLAAEDGGVFALGDAVFSGSMGGKKLSAPITGIAADPDGRGYLLVGRDGGVFAFDAPFAGVIAKSRMTSPIVGIAADPDGTGYWTASADGDVFAFSAPVAGNAGTFRLNAPVVGIAPDPDGAGYWLAAADGGVFAFDALFSGSLGDRRINRPVTSIKADPDGTGYWLGAADGGVFAFGAEFFGSVVGVPLQAPVVGITNTM